MHFLLPACDETQVMRLSSLGSISCIRWQSATIQRDSNKCTFMRKMHNLQRANEHGLSESPLIRSYNFAALKRRMEVISQDCPPLRTSEWPARQPGIV